MRRIKKHLGKYLSREVVSYLVFGFVTTVVSFAAFVILVYADAGIVAANTVSNVIAVLLAFVTNKLFVFRSKDMSFICILKELVKFCSWRVLMFVAETLLLVLLVDVLGFDSLVMKVCTVTLVIISNYCFSKWFVFKGEKADGRGEKRE